MKPPFNCDHQNRLAIEKAIHDLEKGVDPLWVSKQLKRFIVELDQRSAEHEAMTDEEYTAREYLRKYYEEHGAE